MPQSPRLQPLTLRLGYLVIWPLGNMSIKGVLIFVGFLLLMFASGFQTKKSQPKSIFPIEWFVALVVLCGAIVVGGSAPDWPLTTTPSRLILGTATGIGGTVALLRLNRKLGGKNR